MAVAVRSGRAEPNLVRTHHNHVRAVLPVVTLNQRPAEDAMATINAEMRAVSHG